MTRKIQKSWGTTVFCDDFRMEVGGKVTLVGIYTADMVVNAVFPFVLPKFAMWINYFEVPDSSVEDARLNIWFPGDVVPSIETEIPLSEYRSDAVVGNETVELEDSERFIRMTAPIVLAPVVLKQPGYIRVRLIFSKTKVNLGTLQVRQGFVENEVAS